MDDIIQARAAIASAITEDAKCRVPGVTAGLYRIADIAEVKTSRIPKEIASIGRSDNAYRDRIENLGKRCRDNAEFFSRFHEDAPALANFDFGAHGIVIAGGAVSALFLRCDKEARDLSYSDFDCFLVGHKTDEAAREAVSALAAHLGEAWEGMDVYRTANCITFVADSRRPVQVILRRYSTRAEVIHGFDIGSCAFLWDGDSLYMTAMGKVAATYGANILNLQARRVSYENRIARYFDRGFDLVLPQLDSIALAEAEGRLPYLKVHIDDGDYGNAENKKFSNQVLAYYLTPTRPGWDNGGRRIVDAEKTETAGPSKVESAAGAESMFEQSDYAQFAIAYGRPDLVIEHNICAVSGREVYVESLCAIAPWVRDLNIFEIQPSISRPDFVEIIRKAGSDLKKLRRLVGPDHAAALALDFLSNGGAGFSPASLEEVAAALEERFRAQAKIPTRFMTVEDKTALVGPFNRRVLTAEEWYGSSMVGRVFMAPK